MIKIIRAGKIKFIVHKRLYLAFLLPLTIVLICIFGGITSVYAENVPANGGKTVKIIKFEPVYGEYKCLDMIFSSVVFKNISDSSVEVWLGHSVRDSGREWHDADYHGPFALAPGACAGPLNISWQAPDDGSFASGSFLARIAVWSAPPGADGSFRYDFADREKAFYVSNHNRMKTFKLSTYTFKATPDCFKPQGNRGKLVWKNVSRNESDGGIKFVFNKNSFNGGEAGSERFFSYGLFEAEIKTARMPKPIKAITGFFLFDPETEDEITLEIFNDGSHRLWLSAFIGGRQSAHLEKILPFDPSENFNTYAIDYNIDKIQFFINGQAAGSFINQTGAVITPRNKNMKIYFNSWFPSWKQFKPLLEIDTPAETGVTKIKNLKYSSS